MDPGRSGFGAPRRAGGAVGVDGLKSAATVFAAVMLLLICGSVLVSQSWALHAVSAVAVIAAGALLRAFWYAEGPGGLLLWARLIGGVRLRAGAQILTIGTTPGQVPLMLASRFPSAATTIGGSAPCARGRRLPYPDGRFELVALQLSGVGDHEREELLREAARVLARDGSLLVLDYGRASRDEALLRACGLRVRRVRPGRLGGRGGLLVPSAAVVAEA
nr:class I SAM-dependent methyltransferase [Microbacterium azadirachtae]